MTGILNKAYDPELFRIQGHPLIDRMAAYLESCYHDRELPVLEAGEPQDLWKIWTDLAPDADLMDMLEPVLRFANRLHHPRYAGHQVVPPVPLAALGEMVSALLNNGMAIYEMGPSGTVIEREVIEWLGRKCGFDSPDGFLTSGGTAGNLTALLAARQHKVPGNVWANGLPAGMRPGVMVSSTAHYSIDRAVRVMGWGAAGIIPLPVDEAFRIDPSRMEEAFSAARQQGITPVALVGSAGTTATGTYDDLAFLAAFCRDHNLWFHVDGAHGGAVVLSEKYRHLARGFELADSIVIDFHKLLLTPALTTAVLFREGSRSYSTFAQEADYLLDPADRPWYDSAARTLECTKKMMGLKIYLLRRSYGDEIFREYIDSRYDMTRRFAQMVVERPGWEIATAPMSNILCFRYAPSGLGPEETNNLNATLRERFRQEGRFYLVKTLLDGRLWLRMTVMNPFTAEPEMRDILDLAEGWAGERPVSRG
ncbi:MAG TPA: pyridoxal-dependent decarboxylase [Bacteroidales bacterium]|nr:pyridoxal-dependent decarboxylase [Bacteroidales bacterium]HRZ75863.1 pyridoxal-dependent decarboxylase [Bacteroidales bacterium]